MANRNIECGTYKHICGRRLEVDIDDAGVDIPVHKKAIQDSMSPCINEPFKVDSSGLNVPGGG